MCLTVLKPWKVNIWSCLRDLIAAGVVHLTGYLMETDDDFAPAEYSDDDDDSDEEEDEVDNDVVKEGDCSAVFYFLPFRGFLRLGTVNGNNFLLWYKLSAGGFQMYVNIDSTLFKRILSW